MGHDPTEHVQEEIHHHATHGEGGHGPRWIMFAALTAAFLAALAAVTASLASSHLTESTLTRIDANDQWLVYQSKSIKSNVVDSRVYDAEIAGKEARPKDTAKLEEYRNDLPKIEKEGKALVEESKAHLNTHETFETAATMFHISIAVVAIAVVAKRKEFWFMSIVGGVIGIYFFCSALAHQPGKHEETHEESSAAHAAPPGGGHVATTAGHGGAASMEAPPAGEGTLHH